jgi:TfoX/Sxy family transcriptional regulator of competence genes
MGSAGGTRDETPARFAEVVEALRPDRAVGASKMFGAPGLRVGGKVFAMLVHGRLVVKLPPARVAALVAAGHGTRFDPGHGRLMREWVAVDSAAETPWVDLAREARRFVASLAGSGRGPLGGKGRGDVEL